MYFALIEVCAQRVSSPDMRKELTRRLRQDDDIDINHFAGLDKDEDKLDNNVVVVEDTDGD